MHIFLLKDFAEEKLYFHLCVRERVLYVCVLPY